MAKKLTDNKASASSADAKLKEKKVAKPASSRLAGGQAAGRPASLLMDETVKEAKKPKAEKTDKPAVTEVKASLKYLKISARKVTLIANAVKGLNAEEALRRLSLIHKGAALPVKKLIESALANAVHNFKLNREDLMIKNVVVGQAPSLKRFSPAAFGTAHAILKRSCHVEVTLAVAKPVNVKKEVKGQAKIKQVKPATK